MIPRAKDEPVTELWPRVGRAFGLGKTATFDARRRGEFPFPTWKIGGKWVCPTAAVRAALHLDQEGGEHAAEG